MAEGRREELWQHTAWLSAMIANANRDGKKKPSPFVPDDFNPLAKPTQRRARQGVLLTAETMPMLREAFTGKGATK